jgi:serine/threonine protein kinase
LDWVDVCLIFLFLIIIAFQVLKPSATVMEKRAFMSEAALMAQFDHPNVVSLIGVCTAGDPHVLVLQFCENGSLLSFLQARIGKRSTPFQLKYEFMLGVAEGMTYLASLHVVHRCATIGFLPPAKHILSQ